LKAKTIALYAWASVQTPAAAYAVYYLIRSSYKEPYLGLLTGMLYMIFTALCLVFAIMPIGFLADYRQAEKQKRDYDQGRDGGVFDTRDL